MQKLSTFAIQQLSHECGPPSASRHHFTPVQCPAAPGRGLKFCKGSRNTSIRLLSKMARSGMEVPSLSIPSLSIARRKVDLLACLAGLATSVAGVDGIIAEYVVGQRFHLVFHDNVCFVLDIETCDWLSIPVPNARHLLATTVHKGMIFGGVLASQDLPYSAPLPMWSVDVFDLATLEYCRNVEGVNGRLLVWDEHVGKFIGLGLSCAAPIGGSLWLVSEASFTCFPLSDVAIPPCLYNWRTKERWLFPTLQPYLLNTQIVHLRDTYYVCGGWLLEHDRATKECQALSEETHTWQRIAPMNHARHWHTTLVVNRQFLLVVGGINDSGYDVLPLEKYDPETNRWMLLEQGRCLPLTFPRRSCVNGLLL